MEAIILVGIPGAGKSTYYWNNFSDTHLRLNLDSLGRRNRENIILESCIKSSTKICIDNTNITIDKRKKYIQMFKQAKYEIIVYWWDPDIKKSLSNQLKRERKVPEKAIIGFAKNFQEPLYSEGINKIIKVL